SSDLIPFASPNALFGLSKLSIWWLRLGIEIQRIQPGQPQQNGRHERLHLTPKKEATQPAAFNFLQQQQRFNEFLQVYNNDRPHQALQGAYPAEIYTPSPRPYSPPPEPEYPFHDRTLRVTRNVRTYLGNRKISISAACGGRLIGVREVDVQVSLASFLHYDIGFFDHERNRVEPAQNPIAP